MARRKISPLRSDGSFRRRSKAKPPRSVTLIVCDGETERTYFEALRLKLGLSNAEVLLPPDLSGHSPRQLVDFAESRGGDGSAYDRIFCVFDRDDHRSFADARARIRELAGRARARLHVSGAVSVPCWEVWVLLHFVQTHAPFPNCGAVIQRIRTRHMHHYAKADSGVSRELVERFEDAIDNAKWLQARTDRADENPSTSVHHVAIYLRDVAASGGAV